MKMILVAGMWSLCGEIWSTVAVEKCVANLTELNIITILKQDNVLTTYLTYSTTSSLRSRGNLCEISNHYWVRKVLSLFFPSSKITLVNLQCVILGGWIPACWHTQHRTIDHSADNDDVVWWQRKKPEMLARMIFKVCFYFHLARVAVVNILFMLPPHLCQFFLIHEHGHHIFYVFSETS